jgi:predicted MPP superfamily phosphohydrolase
MPRLTRRALLQGSLAAFASGSLYASFLEPGWLDIVRLEVPLRKLPEAFADFTIAQISDLHFGRFIKPSHMEPVIDAVLALCADAIVITGDLVSRVDHGEPDMVVQTLSRLQAPEGVYAVLGNHDWNENGPVVIQSLRRAGITVLGNEHLTWHRGGASLYLAGIDDVCRGKHDLGKSLRGIPTDAAVVTLVHEPDYADIVGADPRVILQLSGHSHGGQVCLPFYGALVCPRWGRKYMAGLYQIRDLTLYTNRGIGMIGLPFRFACRPEITLFTLTPANGR